MNAQPLILDAAAPNPARAEAVSDVKPAALTLRSIVLSLMLAAMFGYCS